MASDPEELQRGGFLVRIRGGFPSPFQIDPEEMRVYLTNPKLFEQLSARVPMKPEERDIHRAGDVLELLLKRLDSLSRQNAELIQLQRRLIVLSRHRRPESETVDYSNTFYFGAGMSAFVGILGYLYFGGSLGVSLSLAAAGPFLLSLWGLLRSR